MFMDRLDYIFIHILQHWGPYPCRMGLRARVIPGLRTDHALPSPWVS